MAWRIKEEHLDAAEGLHRIIYENPEVLDAKGRPQTFERSIFLKIEHCPYCGHVPEKVHGEVDVAAVKDETHQRLNAHHDHMMRHAQKHRLPLLHNTQRGGPRGK